MQWLAVACNPTCSWCLARMWHMARTHPVWLIKRPTAVAQLLRQCGPALGTQGKLCHVLERECVQLNLLPTLAMTTLPGSGTTGADCLPITCTTACTQTSSNTHQGKSTCARHSGCCSIKLSSMTVGDPVHLAAAALCGTLTKFSTIKMVVPCLPGLFLRSAFAGLPQRLHR